MTGTDESADPERSGGEPPDAAGRSGVRGALARLRAKSGEDVPESLDPDVVLWQLEQFTARVTRKHGAGSVQSARARMELSVQLGAMRRWDEACRLRADSYATFCGVGGDGSPEALRTELSLAVALAHAGRWDEADGHLTRAASVSVASLGPDDEVSVLARDRLDEFRRGRPDGVQQA